jgi:fructose-1,6-bisphosphatase II
MAEQLAVLPFCGRVVAGRVSAEAGEGLHVGDEIGALAGACEQRDPGETDCGGVPGLMRECDLAIRALEGQDALSRGLDGALAMIAAGPRGSLMSVPEMYMQKIIVGGAAAGAIDIDEPVGRNIKAVASALGRRVEDLTVVVLDRPRHEDLIEEIKASGARLKLIDDGDVSAGIAAAVDDTGIDLCIGIGGATEGIITAAAMRCLGGEIQGRFWPVSRYQVETIKAMGIEDVEARLTSEQMAGEGVLVAATAVTRGRFLRGVGKRSDGVRTETLLMCSSCHKIRLVRTIHRVSETASPVALWTL